MDAGYLLPDIKLMTPQEQDYVLRLWFEIQSAKQLAIRQQSQLGRHR